MLGFILYKILFLTSYCNFLLKNEVMMSAVSKLKKSRAAWKEKAVERNNELKYHRAEVKRLKADRNKYKVELQDMKRQLAEEQKKTACRLLKIKKG